LDWKMSCVVFSLSLLLAFFVPADTAHTKEPLQAVIVQPDSISEKSTAALRGEGFDAIVLVLDERFDDSAYRSAARQIAAHTMRLYYWIEVGRNPALAAEHPQWMASLGMHDDWRTQFPNVPHPKAGEIVKAWPWTPIAYREAFDAHLARVARLLKRVPADYRGLLLNDLQGGPSSCGCGNLQCRWAIDYNMPSTTAKLDGADLVVRFIHEVGELAAGKEVIPVWTTECEEHDLAPDKQAHRGWSTGYCGGVECFNHQCPIKFNEQWQALHATHRGPTAILALQKEFKRDRQEYAPAASWIRDVVESLDQQKPKTMPRKQLWLVVQDYDVSREEARAARAAAQQTGAGAVLVARTRIDQSYQPRIVRAFAK
jgi:hypothetical protein